MPKHTITAFYDSREYANNAVLMMRQAGIADTDISLSPETGAADHAEAGQPHAKGFWASLEELFGGTDDHPTYAEGVRRGGIMLTAHVEDPKVDDAVRLLEQHGSVDLNERETAWRSEGWTGASRVTGGGIASEGAGPLRSLSPIEQTETTGAFTRTKSVASSAPVPVAAATASAGRDDVVQVVEETLNVGKRTVNRGKVRIHSYGVVTPVRETVSLRDETVTVDRRPVDRPLAAADLVANAFKDRTIEMEEIDEEAVIAKTARVVEEISLRKEVTDSVRTVAETVRSTKVEIEDDRTGSGRTATLLANAAAGQKLADMEVLGSDGQHVGVVDHVDGTTVTLKRSDPVSGGSNHLIPADWVQSLDRKLHLNITAADARSRWTTA